MILARTTLNGVFGANTVSPNDIYAAAKWLWSDYQNNSTTNLTRAPTVNSSGVAALNDHTGNLLNVTLSSTETNFSRTGNTLSVRANGLTPTSGDPVTGLEVGTLNLSGNLADSVTLEAETINNPRIVVGFNGNAAFNDVTFEGDTTINAAGGGSGTRYIVFTGTNTVASGGSLTINRATGDTGTYEVVDAPSGTTYGTGVSAYTPVTQATVQRVNISAIPTGARYEVHTGTTYTLNASPAFSAVRGSETSGFVDSQGRLTFTSGTAGTGETQISGLGGTADSPGSTIQVIQASQTRACRAQAFAVPRNTALTDEAPVINPDVTVAAATDQSANISVGLSGVTADISINSTRLSNTGSDNIYSPTATAVTKNEQIIVQVRGTPAGGEATGQDINYLCALARQDNANYLRNMRVEMGTLVTTNTGVEYDIWQFTGGDQVLVRNETKVLHRADADRNKDLQVLFNYTKSQGNNFTPYGTDHVDRVASQNIGSISESSGTDAAPEVRGSAPLTVSPSNIVDDLVASAQFMALAKEATVSAGFTAGAKETTVNTGFTAGAKEATVNTVGTNVTATQTAVGSVYSGLRGSFDSLTDGTIYQSGTTNFPES